MACRERERTMKDIDCADNPRSSPRLIFDRQPIREDDLEAPWTAARCIRLLHDLRSSLNDLHELTELEQAKEATSKQEKVSRAASDGGRSYTRDSATPPCPEHGTIADESNFIGEKGKEW